MARSSEAVQNPIKEIRKANQKTLEEFAELAGIHLQAVFLNEQGVYPSILPSIKLLLVVLDENLLTRDLDAQYNAFVHQKREKYGRLHELPYYTLDKLGPPLPDLHPLAHFRATLELSRMAFCKNFCVHPAQELRVEQGQARELSKQIVTALKTAGLPLVILKELQDRCAEAAGYPPVGVVEKVHLTYAQEGIEV